MTASITAEQYKAMGKRGKYGARKTVVDGITFDSAREARRWGELSALRLAHKIECVSRQHVYEIAPSVHIEGEKRKRPAVRYRADFVYLDLSTMKWVVEDVKGFDTPVSRLKRHLVKSVLGIDVRVIR